MPRHQVIFDTDPGVDDALALLYLHRHPEIDLLGITTVFGNAPVDVTTRNARFLARSWGIEAPVHAGAEERLVSAGGEPKFPVHIHGKNGLGGYPVPGAVEPTRAMAARFIIETVRANPRQVRLLAVGRMTNLALALQEAPEIADLVRDVVIMGGAFHVEGNATPAAEANIFGDPDAADIAFGAHWPVTAIPLNMTRQTLMTRERLAELGTSGGAAAQRVADLSQDYIDFYRSRGMAGMLVHDCCAAVYLTDSNLFDCRSGTVRVVSGGLASGMTIQHLDTGVSPPGEWGGRPSQRVCYGGQAEAILGRIQQTCTGNN